MKPTSIGAALLAVLLISAPSAWPQTAPAEPTGTAPSERQLQLARELVSASGIDATMTTAFHSMAQQMSASAGAGASPEQQARLKVYSDAEGDALAKLVPKLEQSMETGYAQTFTERELSDMLAFYRSPSGRSMVSKTPQFMQGITAEMIALAPQMRRDIGTEVCAKITCTDAQKAAYFGRQAASSGSSGVSPAP